MFIVWGFEIVFNKINEENWKNFESIKLFLNPLFHGYAPVHQHFFEKLF